MEKQETHKYRILSVSCHTTAGQNVDKMQNAYVRATRMRLTSNFQSPHILYWCSRINYAKIAGKCCLWMHVGASFWYWEPLIKLKICSVEPRIHLCYPSYFTYCSIKKYEEYENRGNSRFCFKQLKWLRCK